MVNTPTTPTTDTDTIIQMAATQIDLIVSIREIAKALDQGNTLKAREITHMALMSHDPLTQVNNRL